MPAKPQEKGRWPFVVADNEAPRAEREQSAKDNEASAERGKV
ncbi:MAG: hypothetical protein ABIP46_07335 [Polaromonas sp.]